MTNPRLKQQKRVILVLVGAMRKLVVLSKSRPLHGVNERSILTLQSPGFSHPDLIRALQVRSPEYISEPTISAGLTQSLSTTTEGLALADSSLFFAALQIVLPNERPSPGFDETQSTSSDSSLSARTGLFSSFPSLFFICPADRVWRRNVASIGAARGGRCSSGGKWADFSRRVGSKDHSLELHPESPSAALLLVETLKIR